MFSQNLSGFLLRYGQEERLSQERLAFMSGISARHMNNIICLRKAPCLGTLERICLAVGASPNELLMPEACAECRKKLREEEKQREKEEA